MLVRARKTVYIKVERKIPYPWEWDWPDVVRCDYGRCLHIERHFITLSKYERVYQFIPYRTSYFLLDLPDREGRYIFTTLSGFQEKLAKAMFRDKKTPKFAC